MKPKYYGAFAIIGIAVWFALTSVLAFFGLIGQDPDKEGEIGSGFWDLFATISIWSVPTILLALGVFWAYHTLTRY